MKNRKLLYLAFALVALIQLAVPFQMIYGHEDVLNNGVKFKFKTQPVDPNDALRGKYIYLRYDAERVGMTNPKAWNYNDQIFARIGVNAAGYAKVISISKTAPADNSSYLKAKINYLPYEKGDHVVTLEFPFDRFYMNENKAPQAESIYRNATVETAKNQSTTYALVAVKNGEAVIQDVKINEVSIKELAKKHNNAATD